MTKQLVELSVKKSADYYDRVVKALEDAGFVIVLTTETSTDRYYVIAESEEIMSNKIAATQITMYLCNQKKPCHRIPICGKDCKHTNDKQYAKHRELFNEFTPMLSPSEIAGGKPTLYLFEKEDEDNDTKNFTYHPKTKGDE